ncbi:hypothetical protein HPB48_022189 [Haemaphysalis longicornis]|uniref:Uncharacterized protein n=1 Tax=Haemaphysalis longicornis TaxID=44386 RepID=A0A9J6GJB6_HAELO|nr:hypothetical protein HPB48_022189 [Haemaphysalis longicornis]
MAAAVKALQPWHQAMTAPCTDRFPTLPQVAPLVHCTEVVLCEHISEWDTAASFARSLLCHLATRFPDLKMTPVLAKAMLVDRRSKDACFSEQS